MRHMPGTRCGNRREKWSGSVVFCMKSSGPAVFFFDYMCRVALKDTFVVYLNFKVVPREKNSRYASLCFMAEFWFARVLGILWRPVSMCSVF